MPRLSELNAMPASDAQAMLLECCASRRWAAAMVAARPFGDAESLHATADRTWNALGSADWHEAFAAHPRIGERVGAAHGAAHGARGARWSAGEQAAAITASDATQEELAAVNRAYEARFGHVYLVCAAGRSAEEMLADARARMGNDAATELRVAAEEQRKITWLRLTRLLEEQQ